MICASRGPACLVAVVSAVIVVVAVVRRGAWRKECSNICTLVVISGDSGSSNKSNHASRARARPTACCHYSSNQVCAAGRTGGHRPIGSTLAWPVAIPNTLSTHDLTRASAALAAATHERFVWHGFARRASTRGNVHRKFVGKVLNIAKLFGNSENRVKIRSLGHLGSDFKVTKLYNFHYCGGPWQDIRPRACLPALLQGRPKPYRPRHFHAPWRPSISHCLSETRVESTRCASKEREGSARASERRFFRTDRRRPKASVVRIIHTRPGIPGTASRRLASKYRYIPELRYIPCVEA